MIEIPRLPIGKWFTTVVDWIDTNLSFLLDAIASVLSFLVNTLNSGLVAVPPLLLAVLFAVAGGLLRSWWFAGGTFAGMLLIQSMRLWDPALESLSLVIVASVVAMLIAVPLGIWGARSERVSAALRPVLDFMQTMPAFVYLIPALFFFSIGIVPGVVATIVFAMPPGARLTELGIRQVDAEVVEAAHAFGASPQETLLKVQLPLATPTIMAGVNQVIMLALSMVVIAGMVGAGGLGAVVYEGVTRLQLGMGFEGGLAVVVLAIYLDRLTSSLASRSPAARARSRAGASA